MARRLEPSGAPAGRPAFVAIMSNGTSGNVNNVNFALPVRPARPAGEQIRIVARSVADVDVAFRVLGDSRPAVAPTRRVILLRVRVAISPVVFVDAAFGKLQPE